MNLGWSLTNANSPLPRGERVDAAVKLDELGYDAVIIGESTDSVTFMDLTEVALRTDGIDLVPGIVNVYSRSPALIAMCAATLDDVSGGRVKLGLGAGSRPLISDWHGMEFDAPVDRLREYIEIIRESWTGDPVHYDGEFYSPSGGRLTLASQPDSDDLPIGIASLGPKNLALTGRTADFWLPHLVPRSGFDRIAENVSEAAAETGRDRTAVSAWPLLPACVHDDGSVAREFVRRHVAAYVGSAPTYRNVVAYGGYEALADEIYGAWQRGDRSDATRLVTDEMIADIGVAGTPSEARATLQKWRDLVDTAILHFPKHPDSTAEILESSIAAFEDML